MPFFLVVELADFCSKLYPTIQAKRICATANLSSAKIYVDNLYGICNISCEINFGWIMKQTYTRTAPAKASSVDMSQKVLQKQEFGRRLYGLILEKDMNQADLARLSGLGRDSISTYVRGRSVPSPQNLQKIAKALGVDKDILYPNYAAAAALVEEPTLQIKAVDGSADSMWLVINMKVPAEKAIEVMKILKSE